VRRSGEQQNDAKYSDEPKHPTLLESYRELPADAPRL
jgi:hypothetical protein